MIDPAATTANGTTSATASPQQQSQNYRQIGTRKGNGRLLLGAAHSYHASSLLALSPSTDSLSAAISSVPSIPSRYETILYTGDTESNAFASRVTRFKSDLRDLPGPGSYAASNILTANDGAIAHTSTSYSKAGYGVGFVSKTQRFARSRTGPGPGSYASYARNESIAGRIEKQTRLPHAQPSSAFHPASAPQLSTLTQSVKDDVPGPGAYNTMTDYAATSNSSPSSTSMTSAAFNTRDRRFRSSSLLSSSPIPATDASPASYNPNHNLLKPSVSNEHAAVFRSTTMRTDFTASKAQNPGPGSYYEKFGGGGGVVINEEKTSSEHHIDHSPSTITSPPSRIFKSTGHDRFGHILEPRTVKEILPGPGSYDPIVPRVAESRKEAGTGVVVTPLKVAMMYGSSGGGKGNAIIGNNTSSSAVSSSSSSSKRPRKRRAAGLGGPGSSLLITRGGPGVALNSSHQLFAPKKSDVIGTFGRSGNQATSEMSQQGIGQSAFHLTASPAHTAASSFSSTQPISSTVTVIKESLIRPPGPAFYNTAQAYHNAQDKKEFHFNAGGKWV